MNKLTAFMNGYKQETMNSSKPLYILCGAITTGLSTDRWVIAEIILEEKIKSILHSHYGPFVASVRFTPCVELDVGFPKQVPHLPTKPPGVVP
jgi:hypothetical protein